MEESSQPPEQPVAMLSTAQSSGAELEPQLIAAAQAGDPEARRTFVRLYQDRVFRLLRRMAGRGGYGPVEVEDLAQETFLQAFASLPRFAPQGPAQLSTWVLTIATRRAIDALRRASTGDRNLARIDPDAIAEDDGRSPEDRLLGRRLVEAIDTLAPDQRAVVILHRYHGLGYDEIAAALEIPAGTVASRLARARAALQRLLEGGGR